MYFTDWIYSSIGYWNHSVLSMVTVCSCIQGTYIAAAHISHIIAMLNVD